jgi:hypothetical protein
MDAYHELDRPHARVMQFNHEDHNGDRHYSYGARWDKKPADLSKQAFFYRAMTRDEALGWLNPGRTALPDANGHHPWASHRDYSLAYLTRAHGYTYLLEVHAPDFVPSMKEIGFTTGKGEAGDISWGIGGRSSNGFGPGKPQNKALIALYSRVFNNGVAVNPNNIQGKHRAMAVKLAPYLFKQSIKWVKVVNLRSQKPA